MDAAPKEIAFVVRDSPEGGYEAEAIAYSIFTFADDWDGIKYMIKDAVLCHFEEGEAPETVRIIAPDKWSNEVNLAATMPSQH